MFSDEFFDLKPVENFKMAFCADGKLVCLEKINNKKSALWRGFKRKDKDIRTTTSIIMYLSRPKGSKPWKYTDDDYKSIWYRFDFDWGGFLASACGQLLKPIKTFIQSKKK